MKALRSVMITTLMVFLFTAMAQAAPILVQKSIGMGQTTTVTVTVKNQGAATKAGTLEIIGTNEVGSKVASFTAPVYLYRGAMKNYSFQWQAPNYKTNLYWSAKVIDAQHYDNDDHDDHDHDSDDGDSDDRH